MSRITTHFLNHQKRTRAQGHIEQEPALFSEPAVFLIQPDGRLYFANIGTHPFSRIDFDSLLSGLAYVIPNNYPLRGTE